jgi:hypothetical protein
MKKLESIDNNEIYIEFNPCPKVEIRGDEFKLYNIEFKDTNDIVHSETINTNMWCAVGKEFLEKSLVIKVNGVIVHGVEEVVGTSGTSGARGKD